MKLSLRLVAVVMIVLLGCGSLPATAKDKDKDKAKDNGDQGIDSGSFGVFMRGHRVGTETFSITQGHGGSITKSEFKTIDAPDGADAVQTSELQLTASGDIRRYEWREVSPQKAESTVVPNDQLITQHWNTGSKEQEQPYLLPLSTSILDDYFFIHRELLVWKFLALTCKQENGQVSCPLKQRSQFGTLNPHQHSSSPMSAEYLGREKISFKGNQQEFNKIELKTEVGSWLLWLDDKFKLVRIVIDSDSTEVIRD